MTKAKDDAIGTRAHTIKEQDESGRAQDAQRGGPTEVKEVKRAPNKEASSKGQPNRRP